jgi:hypothetical protein
MLFHCLQRQQSPWLLASTAKKPGTAITMDVRLVVLKALLLLNIILLCSTASLLGVQEIGTRISRCHFYGMG